MGLLGMEPCWWEVGGWRGVGGWEKGVLYHEQPPWGRSFSISVLQEGDGGLAFFCSGGGELFVSWAKWF